jgi:hypothetical protein
MKLCFDECMPPRLFRQFADMLAKRKAGPIECVHIIDQLKSGQKDDSVLEWLKSQDQPYMMVSADSGAKSKRGDPRMHVMCPAAGITSVFISRLLCQRDGLEKVRMMFVCLPDLLDCYRGPAGKRYRLEAHGRLYRVRPWQPDTFGTHKDEQRPALGEQLRLSPDAPKG